MQEKVCTRCKQSKILDEFNKHPHGVLGRDSRCRVCQNIRKKECRQAPHRKAAEKAYNAKPENRKRINIKSKERYKADPIKRAWFKAYNRKHKMFKQYGLTMESFYKLCTKQSNLCAICIKPLQQTTRHVHVDHDHKTGKVRGILCSHCNVGMGHLFDNINIVKNVLTYLQRYEENL